MKTTKHTLIALAALMLGLAQASADVTRTFTDTQGRKLEATFIKLDGDTVYVQVPATGQTFGIPMSRLSAEDQAAVKTLPPAANANAVTSVATNASASEAAKKIDTLVAYGLQKNGVTPNALMSDEQFVRRVYLDIAGRIPNYKETSDFLAQAGSDKTARAKLIDKLLGEPNQPPPEGYVSNMYNYLADMLRIKERGEGGANQVRGLGYVQWVKEQLRENTHYDKIVYQMLTATGKVWENGAAGYLLRDSGMPLDNLANTLSVFLGTDVACAQCHDHPFANWTQHQFYQMASFFGATTTQLNRGYFGKGGDPEMRLRKEVDEVLEQGGNDPKKLRNLIGNVIRANRYVVADLPENMMKLPPDYKYGDAKPGELVPPKLIHWGDPKNDVANPAYALVADIEKKSKARKNVLKTVPNQKVTKSQAAMNENLRASFGAWLTHPKNPRFAMTIANRLWERAMGMGLTQSVKSIDNPDEAYNPPLLKHLASEMVRLNFDMREFLRVLYNTQTYQREATTADLAMGAPYYFQGPVLRRMTAEQAWDSYVTLVLGDADKYKNTAADLYGRSINMDLSNPKLDAKTVLLKVNAVQQMGQKLQAKLGGSLADKKGSMMMAEDDAAEMAPASAGADDDKIVVLGGMKMMRASEVEQPAPAGHFLRDFGQSERTLIDGSVRSGSVPQVLMMMNGKAQELLTNRDSLLHRTIDSQKTPEAKIDAVFLSILNRKPTDREIALANKQVTADGEGSAFSNIIWALVNTREFSFVQ